MIHNRRDLARELGSHGARISVHGVEAWFRRVDSNYNQPRESLSSSHPSFAVPARHWPLLLELFELDAVDIQPETLLYQDLDLDSLDAVDLVVHLQKLTGKKIKPEEFKMVRSVDDVVNSVINLLEEK